jgi:hypothetical protein
MGENRKMSCAEYFQIIQYDFLFLECGLCTVTFFPVVQYGKGEKEVSLQ